jgi:hypothetical protein
MSGVLAAAAGSDWSSAGALLTFYFPVGLFIVVAAILFLEFSRPHAVPGRKPLPAAGTAVTARTAATAQPGSDAAGPGHDSEPPSART